MTEPATDQAAEIIRDLAQAAARPKDLVPGNIYAIVAGGAVHRVDLTGDAYLEYPARKRGTVTVRDVASLACYYEKHSTSHSEVFADLDHGTFEAVLDAHGPMGEDVAWQQHRIVLELQQTLPWRTWLKLDRTWMSQQQFAEFLEDNCRDLAPNGPVSAADLLEVAQQFQAHTRVEFKSGTRLASGQTQLVYSETIDAKAGQRGDVVIPSEFSLAIVPYEDCAPAIVPARFRYRLNAGELKLGYFLADPARIAREAVSQIGEKVADALGGITVMQGHPA